MKIGIAVSKVKMAVHSQGVEQQEKDLLLSQAKDCKGNTMQVDISTLSKAVMENLLKEDLSHSQRRTITIFLMGVSGDDVEILDTEVGSPLDFHNAITVMATGSDPNAEVKINNRWYPIILRATYHKAEGGFAACTVLQSSYKICDQTNNIYLFVGEHTFRDETDSPIVMTVSEVLEKLSLRPLSGDLRDHADLIRQADKYHAMNGHTIDVIGSVVTFEKRTWWTGMDIVHPSVAGVSETCIIESEMEIASQGNYYSHRQNQTDWPLPFVRVFDLGHKRYVYADVRDLKEHVWDEKAIDRLVLPANLHNIIKKVFDVPVERLFGDVVAGKAGGMIIQATGETGVGKTLTAEVFSNHTKRPLYIMEMAELGTSLASVEDNLRKIFRRSARWNAVLLFDEADVFMSKRDDNLERSAIVGVFLRLMDYYKGLLFMTTNRPEVIDPAFKSRITLTLKYPRLDAERRQIIWKTMLGLADIKLTDEDGLSTIGEIDVNGRQIRNIVRLLKVLHGDKVSTDEVVEVCNYSTQ